jgi:hypothetical protein
MSITNVERSFGELLAAFGDLVVARTRGAPVDAAGGSTRTLARRYRPLVATGSSRPPASLLESFLGGPLTAEPLLADLRRAG